MYALMVPAVALLQPGDDVTAWPLIAAVLSVLAIGVVSSAVTAALLRMGAAGIKPETVVYVVCAVLVAVAWVGGGGALPGIDPADPTTTVSLWLAFAAALQRFTQALYDVVLRRVWPAPA